MKQIERAIKFAIENGFTFKNIELSHFYISCNTITFYDKLWYNYEEDYTRTITSKLYIEAFPFPVSKSQ